MLPSPFTASPQLLTLHEKIAVLHKEHGQLTEKRNSRNITNEFVYRVKLRELQNACKVCGAGLCVTGVREGYVTVCGRGAVTISPPQSLGKKTSLKVEESENICPSHKMKAMITKRN